MVITGPPTRNVIAGEGEIGVASRTSEAWTSRNVKDENPQEHYVQVRSNEGNGDLTKDGTWEKLATSLTIIN